jgi:hypothetical protein
MKKSYSRPQIVARLRQADIIIGQGKTVPEVCERDRGITADLLSMAVEVRRYESRHNQAISRAAKGEYQAKKSCCRPGSCPKGKSLFLL